MFKFLKMILLIPVFAVHTQSCAQVYMGVSENGTLFLSNFKSVEVRELIIPASKKLEFEFLKTPLIDPPRLSIPVSLKAIIEDAAKEYQLDPQLIHAIIRAESGYKTNAVSSKGARGLMQLMPDTGKRFGAFNLLDPRENIMAGSRYIKWLLDRFSGNLELALAGYNAGERAVIRAGFRVPPYIETKNYVPKVLHYYSVGQL